MRRQLIGVSVLLALGFGQAALAADVPLKAPANAVRASWTGCYIGINGGGGWAANNVQWSSVNGVPVAGGPLTRGSQSASGWAAGGQIGCDYQFNEKLVVGIRGMWDGAKISGDNLVPVPNVGNFADQTDHAKTKSFATLTGRVGFLMTPTVMVYGLGGIAWSKTDFTVSTAIGGGQVFAGDQRATGYDVGAGLSWMFAPNWEVWGEYNRLGFGRKSTTLVGQGIFTGVNVGFDLKQDIDLVLVGINYRFGALR